MYFYLTSTRIRPRIDFFCSKSSYTIISFRIKLPKKKKVNTLKMSLYFKISFNFLPSLPHYNFISSFQTQNAKEQQRLGYAPASSCGVFGRFPWVIYHNGAFQWSQLCSFQFPRYDILLFWIAHPMVQINQNKSHVVFCLPTLKAAIVIRIELIRVHHQL